MPPRHTTKRRNPKITGPILPPGVSDLHLVASGRCCYAMVDSSLAVLTHRVGQSSWAAPCVRVRSKSPGLVRTRHAAHANGTHDQ